MIRKSADYFYIGFLAAILVALALGVLIFLSLVFFILRSLGALLY